MTTKKKILDNISCLKTDLRLLERDVINMPENHFKLCGEEINNHVNKTRDCIKRMYCDN